MNTTCTETLDALPLFVYGDLDPAEMGRIGIHIGGCASCLIEHQRMIELLDLVDRVDAPPVRVDVDSVLRRAGSESAPVSRPGAALMLVVFTGLLLGVLVAALMLIEEREAPAVPPPPVRLDVPRVDSGSEAMPPIEARTTTPPPAPDAPGLARRSPAAPGSLVVGRGESAARAVLGLAAAGDPLRDVGEVRRLLAATGVDEMEFLSGSVLGGQIASARAALRLLDAIAPKAAVELAARALRERPELDEDCVEVLAASRAPHAESVLASAWEQGGDALVSRALSRRGGSRAAGAIAARIEAVATTRGTVDPVLWSALHEIGEPGVTATVRILRSLEGDQLREAIQVVSSSHSRLARSAIASLLDDPDVALDAAIALAEQKDASGLDVLLAATRDPRVWERPDAVEGVRTRARAALLGLAKRDPRTLIVQLASSDARDPDLPPLTAALVRVAPEETFRLVGALSSQRSRERLALAIARACGQVEAAAALVPLGSSRRLAAEAVGLLASFGDEAAPHLMRYLGSRYGTEPAREALAGIIGQDLGRDPSAWWRALRARRASDTVADVDRSSRGDTD